MFLVGCVFWCGGLYFANKSRTGRAWRASRDDPLAAEVMGIPVNRVKILAPFIVRRGDRGTVAARSIAATHSVGAVSTNYSVGS